MLGYVIIMFFVAAALLALGVSLRGGNTTWLYGKIFESVQDKTAYAQAIGKIFLSMGRVALLSIIVTLVTRSLLPGALTLLLMLLAIPRCVAASKQHTGG